MHAREPERPVDARRLFWKRLAMLSAAAALLHAAALGGLAWTWPQPEPMLPLPAAALQVRWVEPVAVPAPAALAPIETIEPPAPAVPVPAKKPSPARIGKPAPRVARAAPAEVDKATPPPAPLQLALNTPAAEPAAPDEPAIPHYRTRMPPPTTLRYEMQRGLLSGTGEIAWKPHADRYELRLDARVGGLAVLTQVSAGAFDAAGVAPLRFTDQRLRRGTAAANFPREAGMITFSGPATEFALRAGAQDRLSWMIQLAAIVGAEPHLATPGAKVVMYVVGSHGDASVWVFRCVGPEAVETRAGTLAAVKFVREPRESYDTTVQVWLDPKQHDLPVRATQKSGANDEGFDLRLLEVLPPS